MQLATFKKLLYNAGLSLILCALAGLSLTSCGNKLKSSPTHAAPPIAHPKQTVATRQQPARLQLDSSDRFAVAGTTQAIAQQFLNRLQQANRSHNIRRLLPFMDWPLRVNFAAQQHLTLRNPHQFLPYAQHIITPTIQRTIAQQSLTQLFVNAQGVMLGNGQIWARMAKPPRHQLKIFIINQTAHRKPLPPPANANRALSNNPADSHQHILTASSDSNRARDVATKALPQRLKPHGIH